MKIRPMGAEITREDGQRDMKKLTDDFRNFVKSV